MKNAMIIKNLVLPIDTLQIWVSEALQEQGVGDAIVTPEQADEIAISLYKRLYDAALPDVELKFYEPHDT